jgi:hypothetical protein
LPVAAQPDEPPSEDRHMGKVKQSWQNFAVSLEHGTFFRSADEAVNSSCFIAFYFSESQTSNGLIDPDFQGFGGVLSYEDHGLRRKTACLGPLRAFMTDP